eukprot:1152897-Pelagomonas_calceolata.AAC.4
MLRFDEQFDRTFVGGLQVGGGEGSATRPLTPLPPLPLGPQPPLPPLPLGPPWWESKDKGPSVTRGCQWGCNGVELKIRQTGNSKFANGPKKFKF